MRECKKDKKMDEKRRKVDVEKEWKVKDIMEEDKREKQIQLKKKNLQKSKIV